MRDIDIYALQENKLLRKANNFLTLDKVVFTIYLYFVYKRN